LYYHTFEFNAGLFALAKYIGGYSSAAQFGWVFAILSLCALPVVVSADRRRDIPSIFTPFLVLLATYHLLATTVNPWYLAPLVAFSVFSKFRFGMIWAALIPLSYAAFAFSDYRENTWLLSVQYGPVYLLLISELLGTTSAGRWFRYLHIRWRARIKVRRIDGAVQPGDSILDIGTGNGGVAHQLYEKGIGVTCVDVVNKSAFDGIQPTLYDGQHLPFPDESFSTTMLLTVLHHTPHPTQVLSEAARTARAQVIVMEDVFRNGLQRKLTHWADSLVNWEFNDHPHTNMTEETWEALFRNLGLKVANKKVHHTLLLFRQVTYILHK
jgi:SAM-dependent methyltransferase